MNLKLEGQSVAIFGAAKGIGKAIAEGFQREGCVVRGFDREAGDGSITLGDVADYAAVQRFAASFGS